jgi:hypothetical protein
VETPLLGCDAALLSTSCLPAPPARTSCLPACLDCSKEGYVQSTADAPEGTPVGLVLGATSFYAEAGGQTADTGAVASASGASFEVEVRLDELEFMRWAG